MHRTAASFAAELIEEAEILAPPVNIFALIKLLDIELEFRCELSQEVSGLYIPSKYSNPLIVINANHPPLRQRFTAAHELKHALLDKEINVKPLTKRQESAIEREADSFASSLLMPESMLCLLFSSYNLKSARVLSRVFGVSFESAVYKIYGREGFALLKSDKKEKFMRHEKALYKEFQFTEIPGELSHWISLQSAAHVSNLNIPHCLCCLSVIFDDCYETCWGCGTNLYERFGPFEGMSHTTYLSL